MKFTAIIFFIALVWAGTALPVSAHRYHTSLTRIDYNPADNNIEITIQLFTHDLHLVADRLARKKNADSDEVLFEYLRENFVLKDKNGEVKELKWVGKETDIDSTVIYLEAFSPVEIEHYQLKNTIFFESIPKQTNLVTARFSGKKSDLLFKFGDQFKEISENKKMR